MSEDYTDEELLALARLSLGGLGRAAKAVTRKAGMELGTVKGYTQMRGGKRVQVRQYRRNFDPADLRALQGRPSNSAKPGIMPQGRTGPKSFPALQANHVQEEAQRRAKAVIEKVSRDPTLSAALRNSAIGDKNLVNGMSPDQARQIVDNMMNGREGTPDEAFRELRDMLGAENVPLKPKPKPPSAPQATPLTKPHWQYRDTPMPIPRSDRAMGMKVRHPSFGTGEIQEYGGKPDRVRVRFDNNPEQDYQVPIEELAAIEEVNNWEEVGPLRPGEKHNGKIVRALDGRMAKVLRPGQAAGSVMVDTEEGRPALWWNKELMEVRPPKRGLDAPIQQAPRAGGYQVPRGGMRMPPEWGPGEGGQRIPGEEKPFFPEGIKPNFPGGEQPEPKEPRPPSPFDQALKPGGPGTSSPDWPGTYWPDPGPMGHYPGAYDYPKTWVADDGHEYGIEKDPKTGESFIIDYGVPGERRPGHRPKIYKSSMEALEDQMDPQFPAPPGRQPRPGPGQLPPKPKKPKEEPLPEEGEPGWNPTIFNKPDPFMIQSRNWMGRAKLSPAQKEEARRLLLTIDPKKLTKEERRFLLEAYGPYWEKTLGRFAKKFGKSYAMATKNGNKQKVLSMREESRVQLALAMADRVGMSNMKFYLESEKGDKIRATLEKAFGPRWEEVFDRLMELPKDQRRTMANRTMQEIKRTNWPQDRVEAQQQLNRLQDIFGKDNVKVEPEDLDNPIVQQRLIDFEHIDEDNLMAISDYWNTKRAEDPEFVGQIHIGSQPLSEMDDFKKHLSKNGMSQNAMDDRGGVYVKNSGLVLVGTEDSSSASVAIHEMSHALDEALGFYSQTPEFQQYHQKMLDTLGGAIDRYFGRGPDGQAEAYAEASAALTVGWEKGLRRDDLHLFVGGSMTNGKTASDESLIRAGRIMEEAINEGWPVRPIRPETRPPEASPYSPDEAMKPRPSGPAISPEEELPNENELYPVNPNYVFEPYEPEKPPPGSVWQGEEGELIPDEGRFYPKIQGAPKPLTGEDVNGAPKEIPGMAPNQIPQQPSRVAPENRVLPKLRPNSPYHELRPAQEFQARLLIDRQLAKGLHVLDRVASTRKAKLRESARKAQDSLTSAREMKGWLEEGKVRRTPGDMENLLARMAAHEQELQDAREALTNFDKAKIQMSEMLRDKASRAHDSIAEGSIMTDGVNTYSISPLIDDPAAFREEFMNDIAYYVQLIQENLPDIYQKDDTYGRSQHVILDRAENDPKAFDPDSKLKNALAWAPMGHEAVFTMDVDKVMPRVREERNGTQEPPANPGHWIPEATDLPILLYAMTHEMGHNFDETSFETSDKGSALRRLFSGLTADDMPSGYSTSSVHEMVAEAFTAWMWGDRDNPVVAQIADIMGWNEKYSPPESAAPAYDRSRVLNI